MSTIERMKRYIQRTPKISSAYTMRFHEVEALADERDLCRIIDLAFRFGRAKGYRAAMKEVRGK